MLLALATPNCPALSYQEDDGNQNDFGDNHQGDKGPNKRFSSNNNNEDRTNKSKYRESRLRHHFMQQQIGLAATPPVQKLIVSSSITTAVTAHSSLSVEKKTSFQRTTAPGALRSVTTNIMNKTANAPKNNDDTSQQSPETNLPSGPTEMRGDNGRRRFLGAAGTPRTRRVSARTICGSRPTLRRTRAAMPSRSRSNPKRMCSEPM